MLCKSYRSFISFPIPSRVSAISRFRYTDVTIMKRTASSSVPTGVPEPPVSKRAATPSLTAHLRGGHQTLPELPAISRLSPRVIRVLGQNPSGFTLGGTNTYLVGSGPRRWLIDTGEGRPEYVKYLSTALADEGCEGLERIIVTHWHHDHLGGVPSVLAAFGENLPVLKYMPTAAEGGCEASFAGEGAVSPRDILSLDRFTALHDGDVVRTEGATLRVRYAPGHANDHIVILLDEDSAMFTADNVLGIGTGVFRDLHAYMRSLYLMKGLHASATGPLYPGHGPAVPGHHAVVLIDQYIAHRTKRVDQVRSLLYQTDRSRDVDKKVSLIKACTTCTVWHVKRMETHGRRSHAWGNQKHVIYCLLILYDDPSAVFGTL